MLKYLPAIQIFNLVTISTGLEFGFIWNAFIVGKCFQSIPIFPYDQPKPQINIHVFFLNRMGVKERQKDNRKWVQNMNLPQIVSDTDLHESVLRTRCLISYLNWKMKCRIIFA